MEDAGGRRLIQEKFDRVGFHRPLVPEPPRGRAGNEGPHRATPRSAARGLARATPRKWPGPKALLTRRRDTEERPGGRRDRTQPPAYALNTRPHGMTHGYP